MIDNMNDFNQNYTMNHAAKGRVRMWEYSPEKGYGRMLYDAPNLITYEGSSVAARALAGVAGSGITHMYVGYDQVGDSTTTPTVALDCNTSSFTSPLIVPLAFSPGFSNSSSNYVDNVVYFTIYLTGFDDTRTTSLVSGDSINSLGLVNVTNTYSWLFSKIAVSPAITYNHSLAITWGVTFTAA